MIDFELLEPSATRTLVPQANKPVWVYKFRHSSRPWLLSLATHGEPGSGKLSLGGFRIAPEARVSAPDYNNDLEAIELAIGMEGKIRWSQLIKAGGPLGLPNLKNIVGGKCVLLPSKGARVGEAEDMALLDFAIEAFSQFEKRSGLRFNTGQDLGHGLLSDGRTYSLDYVSSKTSCCINTDTAHPTAEGNYQLLCGMLRALGVELGNATVGLIGCGKIGGRILVGLREQGAETYVLENSAQRRKELEAELDCETFSSEQREQFFAKPMQALVINANARSLDADNLRLIERNKDLKLICGSENLAYLDPHTPELIRKMEKIYCPTELGGMFGYLTAAEVFYCADQGREFKIESMLDAAVRLEQVGFAVTRGVLEGQYRNTFEQEVLKQFGPN